MLINALSFFRFNLGEGIDMDMYRRSFVPMATIACSAISVSCIRRVLHDSAKKGWMFRSLGISLGFVFYGNLISVVMPLLFVSFSVSSLMLGLRSIISMICAIYALYTVARLVAEANQLANAESGNQ